MDKRIYNSNEYPELLIDLVISKKGNDLIADLKFENTGKDSIKLLKWDLLDQGVTNNYFLIVDGNNNILDYIGPMMKRGLPKDNDYIELNVGSRMTNEVILNRFYNFDVDSSEFSVRFFVPFKLSSNTYEIEY